MASVKNTTSLTLTVPEKKEDTLSLYVAPVDSVRKDSLAKIERRKMPDKEKDIAIPFS